MKKILTVKKLTRSQLQKLKGGTASGSSGWCAEGECITSASTSGASTAAAVHTGLGTTAKGYVPTEADKKKFGTPVKKTPVATAPAKKP